MFQRISHDQFIAKNDSWQTLLDLDVLSAKEKSAFSISFFSICEDRALLHLSDGGTDSCEIREFSLKELSFVGRGFHFPSSKGRAVFLEKDRIFISTHFDSQSFTKSGGPRKLKVLKRGQDLAHAELVFETDESEMGVYFQRERLGTNNYLVQHVKTWDLKVNYLYRDGRVQKLDLPETVDVLGIFENQVICQFEEAYEGIKPGSLVAISLEDALAGKVIFKMIHESQGTSQVSFRRTQVADRSIWIQVLENYVPCVKKVSWSDNKWKVETVETGSELTTTIELVMPDADEAFVRTEGFLSPPQLMFVKSPTNIMSLLNSSQEDFSNDHQVSRKTCLSKDGTEVHYFFIGRKSATGAPAPTLIYAYGGFGVPQFPSYRGVMAKLWLKRGGQFVLANIRGGGEKGPEWHEAAKRVNRYKSYEDFIAIAEDLIKNKNTTPKQLAIMGGSNGGLLVGAVTNIRPDLFSAVLCLNALLDLKRYHLLFSGRNWIDEYGNPDDEKDWDHLEKISPFHNVDPSKLYPTVFFETAITDDRVHPAHARRMAALYKKHNLPYWFYENIEGGHSGDGALHSNAYLSALRYAFLYERCFT
ncbi:MAG: S9 family peptidase [Bdellovibrio sp.]|nr:S9 family peptidase [Bdellovibrio sp.]